MTGESTIVFFDRVEKLTSIETTLCDEWRAAVALRGEFDLANAGELRAALDEHLDAGRRVIRINASAVTFIDSTAMGALVAASERCRDEHGSLILTGVPARLKRLLAVAGLDQLLLVDSATA